MWVRRDLEAVLQSEDTALLCTVVMDLADKTGIDTGGWSATTAITHDDAVSILRRYLGHHAAHFWHELRHALADPLLSPA